MAEARVVAVALGAAMIGAAVAYYHLTKEPKSQRDLVKEAYTATARGDSSCCTAPQVAKMTAAMGYTNADRALAATAGECIGLGCGNPVALAALARGEEVLDLGCGTGLDCLLAARAVGPRGSVVGLDMVPEMLARAEAALVRAGAAAGAAALGHTRFVQGVLEAMPLPDASVDVVISNCVINLSQDKPRVLAEAFRVLRGGGRLAISDVVRTADLPASLQNEAALACWVAGAPLPTELGELLRAAGFEEVVVEEKQQSAEYISEWLPGSGAEKYVVSANVTATKPAEPCWRPAPVAAKPAAWC